MSQGRTLHRSRTFLPVTPTYHKLVQYFGTLFCSEGERPLGRQLANKVEDGAVTVTVHPRGAIEAVRANELLQEGGPVEFARHDMTNQTFEHAASRTEGAWIRNFWIPASTEYHCIHCRMFPARPHH